MESEQIVKFAGKSELDAIFSKMKEEAKHRASIETPDKYKKKRKARGGGVWIYVKADFLEDELDANFPGWSVDTLAWDIKGTGNNQFVIATVRLTVYDNGIKRTITQHGGAEVKYYGENNARAGDLLDIANDVKAAETDGFKRCCYKLGFIRDVKYDPADLDISEQQHGTLIHLIENFKEETKEKIMEFAYKKLTRANFDKFIQGRIVELLQKKGDVERLGEIEEMYGITVEKGNGNNKIQDAIVEDIPVEEEVPGKDSEAKDEDEPPW